mgnify:CR=1 FL=1
MTENSDFWFDYDRTPRDVTDMNGRRLEIGEEPVKVTVFAPCLLYTSPSPRD